MGLCQELGILLLLARQGFESLESVERTIAHTKSISYHRSTNKNKKNLRNLRNLRKKRTIVKFEASIDLKWLPDWKLKLLPLAA